MSSNIFQDASRRLFLGEVIAYPTEAVWGLGCDPFNQAAVAKILSLKQRAVEKGLILIGARIEHLGKLLDYLDEAHRDKLMQRQSQPTTWLIPHYGAVPAWITGEHETVAIRISTHPTVVGLCEAFGGMIVSTSANPAGMEPAKNEEEARAYFGSEISEYVSGSVGESQQPSAIIDLHSGKRIR